jgi:hypothetical protein
MEEEEETNGTVLLMHMNTYEKAEADPAVFRWVAWAY